MFYSLALRYFLVFNNISIKIYIPFLVSSDIVFCVYYLVSNSLFAVNYRTFFLYMPLIANWTDFVYNLNFALNYNFVPQFMINLFIFRQGYDWHEIFSANWINFAQIYYFTTILETFFSYKFIKTYESICVRHWDSILFF